MNLICDAKQRLTMSQLWKQLGLQGRAVPGSSLRSPFREDRNPSFAIFKSDQGWKDYGTGESGDQIDLIQKHFACEKREAIRRFLDYTGSPMPLPHRKCTETKEEPPKWSFRLGTTAEIEQVAALRGLSVETVRAVQDHGLLRFGIHRDVPAWIVTDKAAINAQARRLDGKNWGNSEEGIKAITLSGSKASWPLGTEEAKDFKKVAFVEGGPDLLAAFAAFHAEGKDDVAAVAMLGAAHKIPNSALIILGGKRIRIFAHTDMAGQKGATRWASQLSSVGCRVDKLIFPPLKTQKDKPIKDLNDLMNIKADDYETLNPKYEIMP
jgi:DNA primase